MTDELPLSLLECAQSTGLWPTLIPALQIVRADTVQRHLFSLHRPSVCFVLQGRKEVCVGSVVFRYGAIASYSDPTVTPCATSESSTATPSASPA
jgi:hypothetical protein